MLDLTLVFLSAEGYALKPDFLINRLNGQVIIYAPARTSGQQGKANTVTNAGNGPAWKLIFETQQK